MVAPDSRAMRIQKEFMEAHGTTEGLGEAMIGAGVNPYYAWMHVKGVNAQKLGHVMDLEGRFLQVPGLPALTSEQIMDQISHGIVRPDADTVLAFCEALGITPDKLARLNYPDPVDSAIVEAATMYVDHCRPYRPVPEALLRFLQDESEKADDFAEDRIRPFLPRNGAYLNDLEDSYAASRIRKDGDDRALLHEMHEAPGRILELLEDRVGHYEEALKDEFLGITLGVADHEQEWNKCHSDLWRCARAIAPLNREAEWMAAFFRKVLEKGAARAGKMLLDDPDSIYPVRSTLEGDFVHLGSGRIHHGRAMLEAVIGLYKDYNAAHAALRDMRRRREEAITELLDFRQWRHAPETAKYLQAEAHRRHIRAYIDADEMEAAQSAPANPGLPPVQKPALKR